MVTGADVADRSALSEPIPGFFRIEVWPGVLSTIALHEDSTLMCCDMAHKLLRTETVLDFLYELFHRTRGERYYERATQALIGTTVISR